MAGWKNLVALGDSVTEGIGDSVEGLENWGFVDRIAVGLREHNPAMRYANLAKRGLKTREVREGQLDLARALQPDLVSLVAGANDVLGGVWDAEVYRLEMETMLDTLAGSGVTVLMATWPDFPILRKLAPEKSSLLRRQLVEGNQITKALASSYDALLVDSWHYPPSLRENFWSVDLVHPNAHGYREFAKLSLEQLEKRLSARA